MNKENIMKESDVIFSHVVAASQNNVIGIQNQLPWHIPEDLKFFQDVTKGKALIMGRKTLESLGKPLPHRLNIVITGQKNFKKEGVVVFHSIPEALNYCKKDEITDKYGKEIFIIGGAEIYKQTLSFIHSIYITRIHKDYEGDAFYPAIPQDEFKEIKRINRKKPVPFSFLTFKRIKKINRCSSQKSTPHLGNI